MKLCLIVLFVVSVAFAYAESGKEKWVLKDMFIKCAEELQVDMQTIKNNKDKPEPAREVKCVYACVCEKAGVVSRQRLIINTADLNENGDSLFSYMNADGTANQAGADAFIAKLPEEMNSLKENINECMKSMKAGLAKCESGWLVAKCMKDKMPKHEGKKTVESQVKNINFGNQHSIRMRK